VEIPKLTVKTSLIIGIILVVLAVTLRLVPHIPNFAPIGAIALFGGAVLGWRIGLWLPLSAMILSDLVIGFYQGIWFTWGAFLLIVLFGLMLRKNNMLTKIAFGGFASAVIFFVVSNFGVWLTSGMYAHTFAGIVQNYTMALPFFRMTLVSDMFYSGVLFGTYAFAMYLVKKHRKASSKVYSTH